MLWLLSSRAPGGPRLVAGCVLWSKGFKKVALLPFTILRSVCVRVRVLYALHACVSSVTCVGVRYVSRFASIWPPLTKFNNLRVANGPISQRESCL